MPMQLIILATDWKRTFKATAILYAYGNVPINIRHYTRIASSLFTSTLSQKSVIIYINIYY